MSPWRVARARFPLTRSHANARARFEDRETAVVAWESPAGRVGLGELAPLPGYSPEPLEEALDALREFDPTELAAAIEARDFASARAATRALPPSAQAAAELAVLDATARASELPLHRWLGVIARFAKVPATLVDLDAPDDPEAIAAAEPAALKLKIGPDRGRLLALARGLRARLAPGIELRFDANGTLDPERDLAFVDELLALAPALIEEPFASLRAPFPIALDETLARIDDAALAARLREGGIAALVLKPTRLGFLRALELLSLARREGVRAILSHTFEGAVGYAGASELAMVGTEPSPGLDASYLPAREAALVPMLREGRLVAHDRPGLGIDPGSFPWA